MSDKKSLSTIYTTANDHYRLQTFVQRLSLDEGCIFATQPNKTKKMEERQQGAFGPIYTQFENKPKEAMTHLCNVKDGECPKVFYREDVGFVDFVWGKPNDKTTGKGGFGLSHILTDHGDEIKDFNIHPIDFILMIMNFGKLNIEGKKNRIYLEGKEFRLIVTTEWYGKSKQLLLTAFDLRPVSRKNPQRAKEMKKAPKR